MTHKLVPVIFGGNLDFPPTGAIIIGHFKSIKPYFCTKEPGLNIFAQIWAHLFNFFIWGEISIDFLQKIRNNWPQVNFNGKFSGDNIAYIYPDCETALVGKFADDVMIEAREARVTSFVDEAGILKLEISQPHGPIFRHWPSTRTEVVCPHLQRDPFEVKVIRPGQSSLEGLDRLTSFVEWITWPGTDPLKKKLRWFWTLWLVEK